MNKKVNTVLFLFAATVFNILITVLACIALGVIYARVPFLPERLQHWYIPMIFIPSIAISFVVYRTVLGYVIKKFNIEKFLEPIFPGSQTKN